MGLRLFYEENEYRMLCATYDILRKDETDMVWVEAVHDLETAKSRVEELAAQSDREYVIFDQRTQKIVANGISRRPAGKAKPVEPNQNGSNLQLLAGRRSLYR
jgi:hypothetical protein